MKAQMPAKTGEPWDETEDRKLLAAFDIVAFSGDVEAHAIGILERHPLRSLDALQLGCALTVRPPAGGQGAGLVCCDRKLATAAVAEGCSLVIEV